MHTYKLSSFRRNTPAEVGDGSDPLQERTDKNFLLLETRQLVFQNFLTGIELVSHSQTNSNE